MASCPGVRLAYLPSQKHGSRIRQPLMRGWLGATINGSTCGDGILPDRPFGLMMPVDLRKRQHGSLRYLRLRNLAGHR